MIRKLKRVTSQIVSGANIATVLTMLLIGFVGHLNPAEHPVLSTLTLTFPFFLFLNFCFLVFWLFLKPRRVLIPAIGFLICYVPVRAYFPLNVPHDAPSGSIKILSYNVMGFASSDFPDSVDNPITGYIIGSKADIVCLQESYSSAETEPKIDSMLFRTYPYHHKLQQGYSVDQLTILSKYPILKAERIKYESLMDMSMAYELLVHGDTVLVVNNHLETNGMSAEDKQIFKDIVKGKVDDDSVSEQSGKLYNKLAIANGKRGPQADAVAKYIKAHRRKYTIVCGDFNIDPLSYAHHVICDGLTDCYISTANGPGWSYHRSGMYFRIDHIFCSDAFTPYACKVDNSITASDHYPISCWLGR